MSEQCGALIPHTSNFTQRKLVLQGRPNQHGPLDIGVSCKGVDDSRNPSPLLENQLQLMSASQQCGEIQPLRHKILQEITLRRGISRFQNNIYKVGYKTKQEKL